MNNTSEEEDYDEGLPEEEEGITYYIRYCPEVNPATCRARTVTGRAAPGSTTRATWRQMSARSGGGVDGAHGPY